MNYETNLYVFPSSQRAASRLAGLPGLQSHALCGSSRPAPILNSLADTTITFAQVQQGFLLTLNGREFVGSSVVIIDGTTVNAQVLSSTQVSVTITATMISAPESASISVKTPSGNSGYVGCTSGGTSQALVLTIT